MSQADELPTPFAKIAKTITTAAPDEQTGWLIFLLELMETEVKEGLDYPTDYESMLEGLQDAITGRLEKGVW